MNPEFVPHVRQDRFGVRTEYAVMSTLWTGRGDTAARLCREGHRIVRNLNGCTVSATGIRKTASTFGLTPFLFLQSVLHSCAVGVRIAWLGECPPDSKATQV